MLFCNCWEKCVFGKFNQATLHWYHSRLKWQYIRQLPKSKLKMHDYTDIDYIDTCIYKNLNFISNSYRGMYNLKDCNEIKN